jgi:excisionase family DNA binding protein
MGTGYVTIRSAAEILNISTETLRNWDKSGRLKAKRDKNGYRVYNISELERFATQNGLRRKKGRIGLTKE